MNGALVNTATCREVRHLAESQMVLGAVARNYMRYLVPNAGISASRIAQRINAMRRPALAAGVISTRKQSQGDLHWVERLDRAQHGHSCIVSSLWPHNPNAQYK